MDGDGIKELIVETGSCEQNYQWQLYTISDGEIRHLGSVSAFHAALFLHEENGLYNMHCISGNEWIERITLKDGILLLETVYEDYDVFANGGSYFYPSDTFLAMTNILDYSSLEN